MEKSKMGVTKDPYKIQITTDTENHIMLERERGNDITGGGKKEQG